MLVFHDDTAAQETQASHNAGGDTGCVESFGPGKAVLRNDHKQAGSQCYQHMGADPGALAPEFPFIADGPADDAGRQQSDG